MSRPTLVQEEASKLIEKFIPLPADYKDYIPSAKSDQIIIQQNTTIISLILEIIKKIEKIVPRLELLDERISWLTEQQRELIQDEFAVDEAIEKAKRLQKENKNMLFKCKGCKLGELTIEETISHFKLCEARTDNWGYKVEQINQRKSDNFDKILEDMQNSDDELEIDSIISQKELPSTSPFLFCLANVFDLCIISSIN